MNEQKDTVNAISKDSPIIKVTTYSGQEWDLRRIGPDNGLIKLELPEALDETKSSIDSVSDGDDSKERKAAQDGKNLAERVGQTSSKVNPALKNAHAIEYRLEEKRDKPTS
ncbi:hypothetical protein DFH08DRAFT_1089465 [Mycena albidolilacea]|uniref:Uncharacterized protein n=1 Tax=Mycena albidolilacea TaxID=1033008 RepID=A0AAD7E9N3_9AGAR|nr:hypothetical protein DFH08DRAFT_1089465 [Mycena albidolilacea]